MGASIGQAVFVGFVISVLFLQGIYFLSYFYLTFYTFLVNNSVSGIQNRLGCFFFLVINLTFGVIGTLQHRDDIVINKNN